MSTTGSPFHKALPRPTHCVTCGIPGETPVRMSKTRPGIWTDDTDDNLAQLHPDEWTRRTATHRIRVSGLCDRCNAIRKEAA